MGKDVTDFQSPCVSVIDKFKPQYSDISNDDFMDIPSSQIPRNDDGDSEHWVLVIYLKKIMDGCFSYRI